MGGFDCDGWRSVWGSLIPFIENAVEPGAPSTRTDGRPTGRARHGYEHGGRSARPHDPAHVGAGRRSRREPLKRWLLGTHQGSIGPEHLDAYLNESCRGSSGAERRSRTESGDSAPPGSAGSREGTSDEETIRSVPPSGAPRLGAIDCSSTVTQAFPSAIVIACGLPPTVIVACTLSVVGSIRVTVPSPLLATHTDPAPYATPAGDRPTGIVAVDRSRVGVDPDDGIIERIGDPHSAPANGDTGGCVADRDRGQQPARVDPHHVAGLWVGEPYGALADCDPGGTGIRIKLPDLLACGPFEARQLAPSMGRPRPSCPAWRSPPPRSGSTLPIRATVPNVLNIGIHATHQHTARPRALNHPQATRTCGDASGRAGTGITRSVA